MNFEKKSRGPVYRENQIKNKNKPRNYVIVEILLDGMNLQVYYRPWHVVDVYLSIMTLLFFVCHMTLWIYYARVSKIGHSCPSSWWLTTALGLEWFLQFDSFFPWKSWKSFWFSMIFPSLQCTKGHSLRTEVCIHLRRCFENDSLFLLKNMKLAFDPFYNMERL